MIIGYLIISCIIAYMIYTEEDSLCMAVVAGVLWPLLLLLALTSFVFLEIAAAIENRRGRLL